MGPPAELLRGRAGLEAWHNEAKATVQAAQQLRGRCWREALAQWRPPHPPGQPQETPYERRTRLQGWRFKLDVTEAGETLEKPPEGPGITLWKSKMKPPPWVSQLPLPCFRDHCVSQSNGLAARYASAVRLVVSRLHQALTELNEQAKRLNLARQRLDAALAKVRTALLTNQQSALVRGHRPPAEQAPDQVDALLRWERKELQRLKVELEGDMDMSEAHLKALGNCQHTLSMLCQERGQVLELLGQPLRMVLLEAERESWLSLSRPSSPFVVRNPTPEPSPVGPYTPECAAAIEEARCLTLRSKEVLATLKAATAQATASRHQAQVALDGSLQRKMDETLALKTTCVEGEKYAKYPFFGGAPQKVTALAGQGAFRKPVPHRGAFTNSVMLACATCKEVHDVRIWKMLRDQYPPVTGRWAAGEHLYMALGGMRSTLNRCQRFHGELDITQGMTMGPESSQYLEAREKLTRPLVRVYQRHVGTQLPEAQILTQGSVQLERSMQKTAANVQQMQATQRHLRASIRDKQTGFHVDASVQRLRRRRMHPRSSLVEACQLLCS
ncbi:tektin-like protein 1 [Chelonoidis abingdonii]|uniref:tektin-like protein 1 n=1 Tax=Chelonoidis abingdonii TaxID=106734 RepID=UPI003F4986A7